MTPQELEFEYDMATMDLQSKRYRSAEEKFKTLAMTSNSAEAWCGLGMAKYGLIMEHTGIEEVFYCFGKAKVIDETQVEELETIVIETSIEIVRELYNVMLLTRQSINKAQIERANAAIATLASTIMTVRNNQKGRMLGTIATGALTAVSFDSYVKAGASIGELRTLYNQTQELITGIQQSLHSFIKQQTGLVEKFDKILNEAHTKITVTIPIKDELNRLAKVEKRYKFWTVIAWLFVIAGIQTCFSSDDWTTDITGCILLIGLALWLLYKWKQATDKAAELKKRLDDDSAPQLTVNKNQDKNEATILAEQTITRVTPPALPNKK